MRLGVPVPDVRPVFSVAEQRQYGMRGETELRVRVLDLISRVLRSLTTEPGALGIDPLLEPRAGELERHGG